MTGLRKPIANQAPDAAERGAPWQEQAACRTLDPDAWFAEGAYAGGYTDARETCNTICPVRAECLQMALADTLLTYGMYGGLDPDERRALRRTAKGARMAAKPENVATNSRRYALHKAGKSDQEIAAAENVSVDAIRSWRHQHRLPINPGASKSEAAKKWQAEKRAQVESA